MGVPERSVSFIGGSIGGSREVRVSFIGGSREVYWGFQRGPSGGRVGFQIEMSIGGSREVFVNHYNDVMVSILGVSLNEGTCNSNAARLCQLKICHAVLNIENLSCGSQHFLWFLFYDVARPNVV